MTILSLLKSFAPFQAGIIGLTGTSCGTNKTERVQRMKTANSAYLHIRGLSFGAALALSVALVGGPSVSVQAQDGTRTLATGSALPLAPNAPDQYTVKRGDTLWDISKVFLTQPWYWPELWYLNPQVQNPHLIYPGDVLALVNVGGQQRLTIQERGPESARASGAQRLSPQVRSEALPQAVTTLPYDVIAAFMGRPSVLTLDQVKSAPYIVSLPDNHLVGSAGGNAYARKLGQAGEGERFSLVHVGEKLTDPETGKALGYRGIYVGAANLVTPGDPAKLQITESNREALAGDKVLPIDTSFGADFVPHAPAADINGVIFAVNGVSIVGQYQAIAINRGGKQGVEPGQVLAIYQKTQVVQDRFEDGRSASPTGPRVTGGKKVKMPDERVGTAMVYKAYDQMSFALIMETTQPVSIGDYVRNP